MAETIGVLHEFPEEMGTSGEGVSQDLIMRMMQTMVYLKQNSMHIIGETKNSFDTEEQFAAKMGYDHTLPEHEKKWVLIKGQSIAGSKYATQKNIITLPNLVGNAAYLGQAKTEGEILNYEASQNKAHTHPVKYKATSAYQNSQVVGQAIGSSGSYSGGIWTENSGGDVAKPNTVRSNVFLKIND